MNTILDMARLRLDWVRVELTLNQYGTPTPTPTPIPGDLTYHSDKQVYWARVGASSPYPISGNVQGIRGRLTEL